MKTKGFCDNGVKDRKLVHRFAVTTVSDWGDLVVKPLLPTCILSLTELPGKKEKDYASSVETTVTYIVSKAHEQARCPPMSITNPANI
jgi:hypothetical protein